MSQHATEVIQLLSELRKKNISLQLKGDNLKINAPKGALTDEIKTQLKNNKEDIIAALKQLRSQQNERAIPQVDRAQPIAQSYSQERLWFLSKLANSAAYNMAKALRVKGPLDVDVLNKVFSEIVSRHETLRTRFADSADGEAIQIVDAPSPFEIAVEDLSECEEQQAQAKKIAQQEAQTLFDLKSGHLIRVKLLKLAPQDHVLLISLHHIIADGWSLSVLVNEIALLYSAYRQNIASPLADLKTQYGDYAVWQRQLLEGGEGENSQLENKIKFWVDALKGAPDLITLPTDRPRPALQSFVGAHYEFEIPAAVTQRVHSLASNQSVTLFMVLLAGFQILLARWARQDDVCVGVPLSGRDHPATQALIGFFVNGIIMRGNLSGNPTVEEYLAAVKKFTLSAFENQDVPNEMVLNALELRRDAAFNPGAQVGFSLQSMTSHAIQDNSEIQTLADIAIEPFANEQNTAIQDITLSIVEDEDNGKLIGRFEYALDLFDQSTVAELASQYTYLLTEMAARPTASVQSLELLPEKELYKKLALAEQDVDLVMPLTPMQRDIYIDLLLNPETLQNSMGYCGFFNEGLEPDVWQQALDQLVAAEPMMRVEFVGQDLAYGEIAYQCVKKHKHHRFNVLDWRDENLSQADTVQRIHKLVTCPYDLHGPLFHHFIIRLEDERYAVAAAANHIVGDGMAMSAHGQKLVARYQSLQGQSASAIEGDANYFDSIYANRDAMDRGETLAFWQQHYQNVEALHFSVADNETEDQQIRREQYLDRGHWQAIKQYCRSQGITPALYFKCLYGLLLQQYCRAEADFEIIEFNAGRTRNNYMALGVYYQQQPFIFSADSLAGDHDFGQLLKYARQFQKNLRGYQDLSISKRLQLSPPGPVAFTYNYYHFIPQLEFRGQALETETFTAFADHAVQFLAKQEDEDLHLSIEYRSRFFRDYEFLPRLAYLSEQIIAAPEQPLKALQYSLPAEQQWQQQLNQQSQRPLSTASSVQQLIEQQIQQQIDADIDPIAVQWGEQSLSYQQLNRQANQLAHYLRAQGLGRNQRVGLCLERSPELIIALLGVIKAGAAYVPMDSNYPKERLAYLLQDAAAPLLITQACVQQRLPELNSQILLLDQAQTTLAAYPDSNPEPINAIDDLLYVIYTSGSTGEPKGAGVKHRGELNLIQWYSREFQLDRESRVGLISAFGFDLTQKNLMAPLSQGSSLILPPQSHYDEQALAQLIHQHHISHINCAPSAFYPLVEDRSDQNIELSQLSSLRYVIFGGEAIRMEKLQPWLESRHCHSQIINNYGPTECTDIAAFHRIDPPHAYYQAGGPKTVPLGHASDNVQLYLTNEYQQLLPVGLIGELCIAGEGVGIGYLNKEPLTEQNFLDNPYGGGKLYRSGDLVRQRPDGDYEFIGRKDFQVKIRGLRIELGEVEWALRQQAQVKDSLVMAQQDQLIGYVTGPEQALSHRDWRTALAPYLPDYMIPATVQVLEQWPLTPNGKIDRKALPKVAGKARTYVEPRNDVEAKVARAWGEILGLEKVGALDNFFEVGGNSLMAMRILNRLEKEFDSKFRLSMLFTAQTVADVARVIDGELHPESWSPLVMLKDMDADKNLFLFHPVGGTIYCYRELSQHLNLALNIYGVQASGIEADQSVYASFQSMAGFYLQYIKQTQAEGPYYLGGQSLGGLIAWEVARQLRQQGQEVARLVLIDSFVPQYLPVELRQKDPVAVVMEQFGSQLNLTEDQLRGPENELMAEDEIVAMLYDRARQRGLISEELGLAQLQRLTAVGRSNAEAMAAYEVLALHCDVIHIAATQSSVGISSGEYWDQLVDGSLQKFQLSADHESILQSPAVEQLALTMEKHW